jgi:WXG100 family type VII secretion target
MDRGEIYARITQMREAATTIGRSANTVRECIESVDREVWALGADRFMSAGAEAFRGEYTRLKPKLAEAFEQLAMFQDKLNTSADDIEAASRTKA